MKSIPVIVSLTSVDFRIQRIEPVLASILNQEFPADRVVLYLSQEPWHLDKGIKPHEIPGFIKSWQRKGKLEVEYTANTGSYRKLLPILRECRDKDCVIITADDDTLYPTNWISELHSAYQERDTVIGKWGYSMRFRDGNVAPYSKWKDPAKGSSLSNFAIGKDGVLYSPRFFDDWIDREDFLSVCPLQDDVWFKFLTMRTGTGVYIDRGEKMYPEMARPGKLCLWRTNRKQNDPRIRQAMEYFQLGEDDFRNPDQIEVEC